MSLPDPTPERSRDVARNWQTSADQEVEFFRVNRAQLTFFRSTPAEVCQRIRLTGIAARQLHAQGFLSFDPRTVSTLDEAQEAELLLVGPFVAAGCTMEMLGRLLSGLKFPYGYQPGKIYLDWTAARWRCMPLMPERPAKPEEAEETSPEQVFADWINTIKASGDRERLVEIACDVGDALRTLPKAQPTTE